MTQASGKRPKLTCSETNRIGDHLPLQRHAEVQAALSRRDWTYSLDRIVEEMVEGVASLQRA